MPTNLFLVRPGVTDLQLEGRVVGCQDVDMGTEGLEQARRAVDALSGYEVTEVISSPLSRALQTADLFAQRHKIDTTRDPRLTAVSFGEWEGRSLDELTANELAASEESAFAEPIEAVAQRVQASIQQAVDDNPGDGTIVVISHRIPLKLLLAGYLQLPLEHYQRIELAPGSISAVRLGEFPHPPSILATNWRGGSEALQRLAMP